MLRTVGVPGLLGALLLIVWAFGFLILGFHGSGYHLLVPAAGLLIILQGVLRVNANENEP